MLNHHIRGILHSGTLLARKEIPLVHVCYMCPTSLGPNTHLVWVFLSICLDWGGDTSIAVTFSQDWVDSATEDGGITSLGGLLFLVLGFMGVQWDVVSFGAKLRDTCAELGNGSTDVGEFDYNCLWRFAEISKMG